MLLRKPVLDAREDRWDRRGTPESEFLVEFVNADVQAVGVFGEEIASWGLSSLWRG